MPGSSTLPALLLFFSTSPRIPAQLAGKWTVARQLPTSTIGCWDQKQADTLLGTQIEYGNHTLRWKNKTFTAESSQTVTVSSRQFAEENSGSGTNSSQVSFKQLGITSATARQIEIKLNGDLSADPDFSATTEVPGDVVLVKDGNTLIFSVCNVYFEAHRAK